MVETRLAADAEDERAAAAHAVMAAEYLDRLAAMAWDERAEAA